jgi:hypothetical protein
VLRWNAGEQMRARSRWSSCTAELESSEQTYVSLFLQLAFNCLIRCSSNPRRLFAAPLSVPLSCVPSPALTRR